MNTHLTFQEGNLYQKHHFLSHFSMFHTIDLTPYVSNHTYDKVIFQKIKEDKKLIATLPTLYLNKEYLNIKVVACLPNCVKVEQSRVQILKMLRIIYNISQYSVYAFSIVYEDIINNKGYFVKFSIEEQEHFAVEV